MFIFKPRKAEGTNVNLQPLFVNLPTISFKSVNRTNSKFVVYNV